MKHRAFKTTKKTVTILAVLYGLYLVKTLFGINLSNQYSANWIFKAPLQTIEGKRGEFCKGIESTCKAQKRLRNKIQKGINAAKTVI